MAVDILEVVVALLILILGIWGLRRVSRISAQFTPEEQAEIESKAAQGLPVHDSDGEVPRAEDYEIITGHDGEKYIVATKEKR